MRHVASPINRLRRTLGTLALIFAFAAPAAADDSCRKEPDAACVLAWGTKLAVGKIEPFDRLLIALVEARLGKGEAARDTLARLGPAAAERFDDLLALAWLGETAGRLGDRAMADAAFGKALAAIERDPDKLASQQASHRLYATEALLTLAFYRTQAGHNAEAAALARRALGVIDALETASERSTPPQPSFEEIANALLFAGIVLSRAGERDAARAMLNRAATRVPLESGNAAAHAGALARLARLQQELGDTEAAQRGVAAAAKRIEDETARRPYDELAVYALQRVLVAQAVLRDAAGARQTLAAVRALLGRAQAADERNAVPELMFRLQLAAGAWPEAEIYFRALAPDARLAAIDDTAAALLRWGALGTALSAVGELNIPDHEKGQLLIAIARIFTDAAPY